MYARQGASSKFCLHFALNEMQRKFAKKMRGYPSLLRSGGRHGSFRGSPLGACSSFSFDAIRNNFSRHVDFDCRWASLLPVCTGNVVRCAFVTVAHLFPTFAVISDYVPKSARGGARGAMLAASVLATLGLLKVRPRAFLHS